jgi:hypothetical protein
MFEYLNKLKTIVDNLVIEKKEYLNNLCQSCEKNNIEVEWRPYNFCDEYFENEVSKYRINIMFFCKSCYEKLIEINKLEPGQFDLKYWEDEEKKEEN